MRFIIVVAKLGFLVLVFALSLAVGFLATCAIVGYVLVGGLCAAIQGRSRNRWRRKPIAANPSLPPPPLGVPGSGKHETWVN